MAIKIHKNNNFLCNSERRGFTLATNFSEVVHRSACHCLLGFTNRWQLFSRALISDKWKPIRLVFCFTFSSSSFPPRLLVNAQSYRSHRMPPSEPRKVKHETIDTNTDANWSVQQKTLLFAAAHNRPGRHSCAACKWRERRKKNLFSNNSNSNASMWSIFQRKLASSSSSHTLSTWIYVKQYVIVKPRRVEIFSGCLPLFPCFPKRIELITSWNPLVGRHQRWVGHSDQTTETTNFGTARFSIWATN